MNELQYYKIGDGRVWDIVNAQFVAEYDQDRTVVLYSNGKPADADYLKKTLQFYKFKIGDELLSDDERSANIRVQRDELLAQTDYLLMNDYPIDEQSLQLVKQYRQALRDIPQQKDFPNNVQWPDKPLIHRN